MPPPTPGPPNAPPHHASPRRSAFLRWPCQSSWPPAARATHRLPARRGGMPPAEVGVVTVNPGDVGLITELPGRLEASRVAQVRARAAGILQKRLFREGSDVKAGQPLFEIDASPYQATLASAQASAGPRRGQPDAGQRAGRALQAAGRGQGHQPAGIRQRRRPRRSRPRPTWPRARPRCRRRASTWATPASPRRSPGRIGRALVTEGALVGQGEATPLAVIQQIDPLYVNFTQSAGEVMRAAPGHGKRPVQARRRAGRQRARAAGRRQRIPAARQAAVLRPDGGHHHRPDHAARRGAQPRAARCCPACTCACGWSRRRPATPSRCRSRR